MGHLNYIVHEEVGNAEAGENRQDDPPTHADRRPGRWQRNAGKCTRCLTAYAESLARKHLGPKWRERKGTADPVSDERQKSYFETARKGRARVAGRAG